MDISWLILIAVVVIAGVALAASKKKRNPAPPPAPTGMADWRIGPTVNGLNYSVGMPIRPTKTDDGVRIDFPDKFGHVNYMQLFDPPPLGDTLTLRYRFEGGPVYGAEAPNEPATVSCMIQRRGDDWRSVGFRFWSQMIPLTNGEREVVIPLTPEHWGDMLGAMDARDFSTTIRNPDNIGVTFGSPSAPTHGAFGTGQFTLLSLT